MISKEDIDTFKSWLAIEPDRVIEIRGYASTKYNETLTKEEGQEYNKQLSQERAERVASYLQNNGIDASRIISVVGMGETEQFSPNEEENRRVQLRFNYEKKQDN